MTTKVLTAHPYAQAYVVLEDNGDVHLISYTTCVINLTHDGWLDCTGTYSNTTRRHIGAFMREYVTLPNGCCGEYGMAKWAYEHNHRINVFTGEVEEL